jgi:hypothetical protein
LKRIETIALGMGHERNQDEQRMQAIVQYMKGMEQRIEEVTNAVFADLSALKDKLARTTESFRAELDAIAPVETEPAPPPPPRRRAVRRTPSVTPSETQAAQVRRRTLPQGDDPPRDGRADVVMDTPAQIDGRFPKA